MYPSSELCRAQQALQLDRAAASDLANIRDVAVGAAAAWAREAVSAEKREKRRALCGEHRATDALAKEQTERAISENPDRGFALA
ncbi:MAG: hypothetical protein H7X93_13695 [Sphingomonadaceae bacterium]|nr:hypothetical protein [Sphingomonadaceae bacterium]